MRNNAIARIVSEAKNNRKRYSEEDITKMQSDINLVAKCYKQVLSQYSELSEDELRKIVIYDLIDSNNEYTKKANTKGTLFQLEGIDYLLKNRDILENIYEKIKDNVNTEKTDDLIYNSDLSRSCENLVKQAISELEGMKKDLDDESKEFLIKYEKMNKVERERVEKRYSKQELKRVKQTIPMYIGGYTDRIFEYLKTLKQYVEEDIREQQYSIMAYIGEALDQFGLLDRYLKIHNNQIRRATGIDLEYKLSKDDQKEFGVKELFTKEFLSDQSLEDLLTYSMFWQNRYSKAYSIIGQGIYAIDTLGLWSDISKGKYEFNIDRDQLEGLLKKETALKELSKHIMSNLRENAKLAKPTEMVDDNCVAIFTDDVIEKYNKQEGENYQNTFDTVLSSSKNYFTRDIEMYNILTTQIMNTYRMKDGMMAYKIRSLFDSKKTKNWGITLNEIKDGKESNPFENNSKNVLIGIDYEGINMPLRLHISKDLLIKLVNSYNGKTIIPVYEGAQDFVNNGEVLTTNILMPISKRYGKLISEAVNKNEGDSRNNDLLEHLLFLKNADKYPRHLKNKVITKKGIVYERPARKYVNLLSGEEYNLNGQTYIKVEEGRRDEISK